MKMKRNLIYYIDMKKLFFLSLAIINLLVFNSCQNNSFLPHKVNLILASLVCGCHFRATGEAGNILPTDLEFRTIYAKGIKAVLISICGFDEIIDSDVIVEAINLDNLLKA